MHCDSEAPKSFFFLSFFQLLFLCPPFEGSLGIPPFSCYFSPCSLALGQKTFLKMDSFLVPVRRKPGFNRSELLSEVETILATEGHAVICGEGGTGYA